MRKTEPHIEIEGNVLTPGQSMTIRVAVESFASWLVENGLGEDEHGKRMVKSYSQCIVEIRNFMYKDLK